MYSVRVLEQRTGEILFETTTMDKNRTLVFLRQIDVWIECQVDPAEDVSFIWEVFKHEDSKINVSDSFIEELNGNPPLPQPTKLSPGTYDCKVESLDVNDVGEIVLHVGELVKRGFQGDDDES